MWRSRLRRSTTNPPPLPSSHQVTRRHQSVDAVRERRFAPSPPPPPPRSRRDAVGEVDQFSGNQLVPLPSEWRRRRLSLDDWRENEPTDDGGPAGATPPPPRDFRAAVGEAFGVAFGVASGDGVSSRIW